ncbi:hypothetical protein [Brevibacillus choshinensis]|uniref:Uncharacterized protein n=1 Tax=Brevibacillus choshinensis TaxID=54911 RepID=A0ABX7FMV1_BRECH|nr:hypothetical protein [Brevibacillus choshinensis]QRG66989.1 hypothetical protein JNE38_26550 [Brevibacillus choshinensis]
MFGIQYDLNLSGKELSQLSLENFEVEYGGVLYGQLEIKVNDQLFGSCDPENPQPLRDFSEAPIIAWLGLLCDVVVLKQSHPYVALNSLDEVFLWFEFVDIGKSNLQVALIQVDERLNTNDFIITERINQISKCLWKEEIKKQELITEILLKADGLVYYLENVNPALLKSSSIKSLAKRVSVLKKG